MKGPTKIVSPSSVVSQKLNNSGPKIEGASWNISCELPVSFVIKSTPGLLNKESKQLLEYGSQGKGARRLIIVDSKVQEYYGDMLADYFQHQGIDFRVVAIDCSETTKNLSTLMEILNAMEDFQIMRRNEPLIVIGGGVLLDVAGMAAGLYRRGVPYIKVPTTLLALVDASVGAKVAINLFDRRNRVGAYYPPVAAYLDSSFLVTLQEEEMSNGLAEILKIAIIKDYRLFSLIEQHGRALIERRFSSCAAANEIINRAIEGMVQELEPNLWEKDLKRLVDFGHSFSPLIEMRSLPELSHGEAVMLDILFSCIISHRRGMLNKEDLDRVFRTVESVGLPTFHPLFSDVQILKEALADTMRHRNGAQNLPLPSSIGTPIFCNDLSDYEIEAAAKIMKQIYTESPRNLRSSVLQTNQTPAQKSQMLVS